MSFWQGRKVLITGHTGFKGGWLSLWLANQGARVVGLSLPPSSQPNFFEQASVAELITSIEGDIRDPALVSDVFQTHKPEIVFHLAAQSLVRYSYHEPVETYATNVMGTLHILEAIRSTGGVLAGVLVTSDKCYENPESDFAFKESDPMGGHDPYSSSKGCAELLVSSYRKSFLLESVAGNKAVPVATARAGNVIGGGDWSEDRLIPDIMRAFGAGEELLIRNPSSLRPWQHVLESLSGYKLLAEKLVAEGESFCGGWNFGPAETDAQPVEWIVDRVSKDWPEKSSWRIDAGDNPHEAKYLRLDSAKANKELNWRSRWDLAAALRYTVEWYLAARNGEDMRAVSSQQISHYEAELTG